MEDTRIGFLTPEQEQLADDFIDAKGAVEAIDGIVIRLADNKGLEAAKKKIVEKWGQEVLPDIYEVVDVLFVVLEAMLKPSEPEA